MAFSESCNLSEAHRRGPEEALLTVVDHDPLKGIFQRARICDAVSGLFGPTVFGSCLINHHPPGSYDADRDTSLSCLQNGNKGLPVHPPAFDQCYMNRSPCPDRPPTAELVWSWLRRHILGHVGWWIRF